MNVTDADGEELENDKIALVETMLEKEIGDEKEKEKEREKEKHRKVVEGRKVWEREREK